MHDPSYRAAIEQCAAATWRSNRDAAMLDQAVVVQVFAILGWTTDRLGQVS
ncbi:hypothetical protein [Curtobacterium sp. VKM Ac-1376]|uniref:hypothetical protein n=1 Tax=Curtobacterium sp. VKM Ac-1376 TaxID=123312 RepID=UPI00188B4E96|nr:hypothetical protein [Curtobacterium sp. VKM Ac-1376]MBF4612985.1 hypothetical protein [Curtobacterium sp. VKM Ac-1376]